MQNLKIATAHFEHRSADKAYNLATIRRLSRRAAELGAHAVAFHECSVTGYTFARKLSKEQLVELAEFIPEGPSVRELQNIAAECGVAVLAGLFERDAQGNVFKAYVCVNRDGMVARFRKLHPFIQPAILPGA